MSEMAHAAVGDGDFDLVRAGFLTLELKRFQAAERMFGGITDCFDHGGSRLSWWRITPSDPKRPKLKTGPSL